MTREDEREIRRIYIERVLKLISFGTVAASGA